MKQIVTKLRPYLKDPQNITILAVGALLIVTSLIGAVIKNQSPYKKEFFLPDSYKVSTQEEIEGWGRSFEPAPEEEPEKSEEPEVLAPPDIEEVEPFPKIKDRFKSSDLIKPVDEEAERQKKLVRKALHLYNKKEPFSLFVDGKDFMEQYKNQPINKLRKDREKAEPNNDLHDVEKFCDVLGDCTRATKPVNLEHVVPRGTPIPAVVTHDIHSQIQSLTIQLQVTQDVIGYHGDEILIPKNSIAICENIPVREALQTRLAVICKDLLTPNGVRIAITGDTADKAGAEGVQGITDFRFLDQVKRAGLISLIPIATNLSINTDSQSQANAAEAVTQIWTDLASRMLDQTIDTVPTIYIEAGTQVLIKPQENMVFREPQHGVIIPTWGL